tara:strand:- start:707 stop:1189 length:483 start_codon:yes stop_codon:yes gene_type:complete
MSKNIQKRGLSYSESEVNATENILKQYTDTIFDSEQIDIRQKGRTRETADLVKIFCKHACYNLGLSLTRVGHFLGRDHATVRHACIQYDNLYLKDDVFSKKARFFIDRFYTIDGQIDHEPNKKNLISLINKASEKTRGDWLQMIMETEIIKQTKVEYEQI